MLTVHTERLIASLGTQSQLYCLQQERLEWLKKGAGERLIAAQGVQVKCKPFSYSAFVNPMFTMCYDDES